MRPKTIQRRVEALEAKQAPAVAYIWRETGESVAAAIKRRGIKPDQHVVVYSWAEPG